MEERNADILLVEDDPDDRMLIQRAIARTRPQLQVQPLNDGVELLRYLEACTAVRPPRLILLDLNMPRCDGREILERLFTSPRLRLVPVVVLTTSIAPEDRKRAIGLGASGFISKPDTFAELTRAIGEALEACLGSAAAQEGK